jgi:hypothetical protein
MRDQVHVVYSRSGVAADEKTGAWRAAEFVGDVGVTATSVPERRALAVRGQPTASLWFAKIVRGKRSRPSRLEFQAV